MLGLAPRYVLSNKASSLFVSFPICLAPDNGTYFNVMSATNAFGRFFFQIICYSANNSGFNSNTPAGRDMLSRPQSLGICNPAGEALLLVGISYPYQRAKDLQPTIIFTHLFRVSSKSLVNIKIL